MFSICRIILLPATIVHYICVSDTADNGDVRRIAKMFVFQTNMPDVSVESAEEVVCS